MQKSSSTDPGQQRSSQNRRSGRDAQEYTLRNQRVMVPDGYLAVGMVAGVHGIRGEVKVELHTDFPERFAPGVTLYLGEDLEEVEIVAARPHKGALLVKLSGVETRSEAEDLRGGWLFIDEADAADLDEDTYWIHDIIGLAVETESGQRLGQIVDILVTGANDVYVVRPEPGINRGRELLLPAIADVVLAVDVEQGSMIVRLPEGLLDEELGV